MTIKGTYASILIANNMTQNDETLCKNCGHEICQKCKLGCHNPDCEMMAKITIVCWDLLRPAAQSETPEDHQTIKEGMERLSTEPRAELKVEELDYLSDRKKAHQAELDRMMKIREVALEEAEMRVKKAYEKGFTHGSEWKKSREEEIRKALAAYREKVVDRLKELYKEHGFITDDGMMTLENILSAIHQLPIDQPHEK